MNKKRTKKEAIYWGIVFILPVVILIITSIFLNLEFNKIKKAQQNCFYNLFLNCDFDQIFSTKPFVIGMIGVVSMFIFVPLVISLIESEEQGK